MMKNHKKCDFNDYKLIRDASNQLLIKIFVNPE